MKNDNPIATLYVYNYISSSNMGSGGFSNTHKMKAFFAPNDDFMTSIFEAFIESEWEDSWGDFEEFERRDDEGGFAKWELIDTLGITEKELETQGMGQMGLGSFKELIEGPLEDFSIEDFEFEGFDESSYNKLFFDAKSLINPFKRLSNSQLDSLIEALESLKK